MDTDGDAVDADGKATPSDTMRARGQTSRWKLWVLMNADRRLVAGAISLTTFLVLVAVSFLDLAPMRAVVDSKNALWWVFSPMIGAIITGVTLVVSFNQLVLSQELGPLGDQRERMQGAIAFREDVEPWLDTEFSPPTPASFLEALLDGLQTQTDHLEATVGDERNETLKRRVTDYAESVTQQAESVGRGLSDAQFGAFDVLYSALNFNYSWKMYEAKRLQRAHEDTMTDDTKAALEDVRTVLEFFGPAREHFKTLYFQWELIDLSRTLLYAAIPALVVTLCVQLYVDTSAITGATFGVDNLVWLVCAAATLTLTPFVILVSYVLRIVTVAKRTLAIGPFILRETDRTSGVNWDE
ncbi:MAG: hypothetical protein ACQETI_00420 [Halobacteriota archaeon]